MLENFYRVENIFVTCERIANQGSAFKLLKRRVML